MKSNYSAWNIQEVDYPKVNDNQQQWQFLLNYGLLAASTFNAQPWRCRITEKGIELLLDRKRLPTVSDKTGRFGYITMGCFIANIEIAAAHFGWQAAVKYDISHSEELQPVAIITLNPAGEDAQLSQLFGQITVRATNRSPHMVKQVPEDLLEQIKEYMVGQTNVHLLNSSFKEKLKELSLAADLAIWSNVKFRKEHVAWVRNNFTRQYDGMPGFGVGVKDLPSLMAKIIIMSNKFASLQATKNKNSLEASSGYMVLTGQDIPEEWLNIGRSFQRISLFLTKIGIVTAPMGQFIEHEQTRQKLHNIIDEREAGFPQLFCRIGYPSQPVRHSPRRRLKDILIS